MPNSIISERKDAEMEIRHQYIERETREIRTESLYWDRVISFLYSRVREDVPRLFNMLTGPRLTGLIGFLNYDLFIGRKLLRNRAFMMRCGIDFKECLDPPGALNTAKKIFERKIRYWECRPTNARSNPSDRYHSCRDYIIPSIHHLMMIMFRPRRLR